MVPLSIREHVLVPGDDPVCAQGCPKHRLCPASMGDPSCAAPWDETPTPAPGTSSRHLLCSSHTAAGGPGPASCAAAHPFTIQGVIKEKRPSLGSRGERAITAARPAICMQCTFGFTKLLKTGEDGGRGNIKSNY